MSKQVYDDQTLTQYILGALSEAETERLDELSLTDDDVAEALEVAEQELVDAYVQDELNGAALAQFKSHYLTSPLRREKVAFARAFQARAVKTQTRQASMAETVAEVASQSKGRSWFSILLGSDASRPALRWGAAIAALALFIAGVWLIFERVRPHQQIARTQTQPVAPAPDQREQEAQRVDNPQTASTQNIEESASAERQRLAQERTPSVQQRAVEQQRAAGKQQSATGLGSIVSFAFAPQMRGASQMQTISIPSHAAYVAMSLSLEPNQFSTYHVSLLDETGGQTLWRSSLLKAHAADGSQVLKLGFRARLLRPQTRYVLRVTGGEDEIVDDYPFRVK